MKTITLSKKGKSVKGIITLAGSKSISNRALIIRALCEDEFAIHKIASSNDTEILQALLADGDLTEYDCGPAGTTFRFLTAYLSMQSGTQVLTGTERMKQRPIGVLVDALKSLGADIEYLESEGYPPLKIRSPKAFGEANELTISAGTSSQYISALLMIAPTLPNGLKLTLDGKIVSRPYIEMTLNLMAYFGVAYTWEGQTISVAAQKYQAKDYTVEADWSAASYYYSIAAFAEDLDLQLNGLFEESVQGDSAIVEMYERLGVATRYTENGVHLTKNNQAKPPMFEQDFLTCPDTAQTLFATCAGLGVQGLYSGLETLRIKETDRIKAMQTELGKLQVYISPLPKRFSQKSEKEYFMQDGTAQFESTPTFPTYEDHRMAMCLAPLAMLHPVQIEEPSVVKKSYPEFWDDLEAIGFVVS